MLSICSTISLFENKDDLSKEFRPIYIRIKWISQRLSNHSILSHESELVGEQRRFVELVRLGP